jgi:dTMP kinase
MLEQHFRNDPDVVFTREPTTGWIGDVVNQAISSRTDPMAELFLFIADHADHLSSLIRPALDDNKIVISDRYSDSRYAYQGVTLQGIIKFPLEWVIELHKDWTIIPKLTILLDINPTVSIARVDSRSKQTKFEKIDFLQQVRDNYLKLVDMEPDRFLVVDAQQPIKKVKENILAAVVEIVMD